MRRNTNHIRPDVFFLVNHIPLLLGVILAGMFSEQIVGVAYVEPLLAVLVSVSILLVAITILGSPRQESRLMNGSVIVLSFYVLRFTGGALVSWSWPLYKWQNPAWRTFYDMQLQPSVFNPALLMALLGLLGLYSGLAAMPSKPLPMGGGEAYVFGRNLPYRAFQLALLVLVCGVLSMLAPVQVRHVLTTVGSASAPLAVFASYWAFRDEAGSARGSWFVVLGLVLAPLVISTVESGMREGVLKLPVYATCGYVLARRRLPKLGFVVMALAGLLIILPVLNAYKAAAVKKEERVDSVRAVMESDDYRGRSEDTVRLLLIRLNGTSFLSAYGSYYDSVYPFAHGDTFILTLQGLIPRMIWPDKPEISAKLNVYAKSVGILGWTDDETTATFDSISEYYLNFGYVGVVVLAYLHGVYLGWVRRIAVKWCQPLLGGIVFLSLVILDHDQFGLFQLFVSHSRTLAVWIIVFRVFLFQKRHFAAFRAPAQSGAH